MDNLEEMDKFLKKYNFPKLCCWIIVVRVGTLCIIYDFRENAFNFLPLRIRFAMGLSYMAFIMLRYVPFMPALWKIFIINGCWILSKAISGSIKRIIWFFSFNLLMCITFIDLWILKNPCIPGIKPTWSWCIIFLILLDSVC